MFWLLCVAVILLIIPLCACTALLVQKLQPGPRWQGLVLHEIVSGTTSGVSWYNSIRLEQGLALCMREKHFPCTVENYLTGKIPGAFPLTFDDGFASFYTTALPILSRLNLHATLYVVVNSFGEHALWDIYGKRTHITLSQLHEVVARGHEIGSHTLSHPDLTRLRQPFLMQELSDSKSRLENIIGKPVTSFSFPFGCANRRVIDAVFSAGYTNATLYRPCGISDKRLIPVAGVYAFDKPEALLQKICNASTFGEKLVHARTAVMPHYAQGTPMAKWRKEYCL